MTAPNPPTALPSAGRLFALVALVAVVLAALVGVYITTPVGQRPQLLDDLSKAGPQLLTFAGVVGAWFGVRTVKGQQAEHTQQLAQITHQTNGVLTQRISDVVASQLDARGLYNQPAQPGRVPTMTTPTSDPVTPDTAAADEAVTTWEPAFDPYRQPDPASPPPATEQPAEQPADQPAADPAPVPDLQPAPEQPATEQPPAEEPPLPEPAPSPVAPDATPEVPAEVEATAEAVEPSTPQEPTGPPQPTFGTVAHTEG